MEEPSILDYVKALLTPWRGKPPEIRYIEDVEVAGAKRESSQKGDDARELLAPEIVGGFFGEKAVDKPAVPGITWPYRSLAALVFALMAQFSLDVTRSWYIGTMLYLLAVGCLILAIWRGEWILSPIRSMERRIDSSSIRISALGTGIFLAVIAFFAFSGNKFSTFNVIIWMISLALVVYAFWSFGEDNRSWLKRVWDFFTQRNWEVHFSWWNLAFCAVLFLSIFYRFYQLNEVPAEMISDHAEKLLDVQNVLGGELKIFFPRNTGREAIQMYLTAAIAEISGTGTTFLSLKLGTALAGLATLPFIYLLGKEIRNPRVGILAMLLTGIAYWPNVISRIGLRFTLYPLFVAPTLYFLIRGLRTGNRNDFIFAGLAIGLGLHGYSAFRIVPFLVLLAIVLYLIHHKSLSHRKQTIWMMGGLIIISIVVALPLLSFAIQPDNRAIIFYRILTRVGELEQPIPGPGWQILLSNLGKALAMFAFSNGEIWAHSIPYRPALDIVSAPLFYLGSVLLIIRYIRKRDWIDLFLLISVPFLMLPSILSLAFPSENPSLNRTSGAFVVVFVIAAISTDELLTSLSSRLNPASGKRAVMGLVISLIYLSATQNYDLVFNQYAQSYRLFAWNTSDLGRAARGYIDSMGDPDTVWVVPYPHWVDTRLVAMNAGYPTRDYALWPEDFEKTLDDPRSKMFMVKLDDQESLAALQRLYPEGWVRRYHTSYEHKDFWMFFVPPVRR